jgi:Alr-MurF fusion protein
MPFTYTPHELARVMDARMHGDGTEGLSISILLTDSRKITFAHSAVFFALKTAKNDGHRFIPELIDKGVSCFVVSSLPHIEHALQKASFLLVDDTLRALQKLATHHRDRFIIPMVAITGSNGKTIVKEWLAQLLAPDLKIVKSPRSYNSQIGVPLSLWNIDSYHEMGIIEAGISTRGEMERLGQMIKPQAGIFTNIGPAHDEGFDNTEEKIFEKLKLFNSCKLVIYSSDHPQVAACVKQWAAQHPNVTLFSWGTLPQDTLHIISSQTAAGWQHLELEYKGNAYSFHLPFSNRIYLENLMHCLAFVFTSSFFHPEMIQRVQKLEPLAMRMEMKQAINECLLINDAYNSDILSLAIALDFLVTQPMQKKKVLILSDIMQSGLKPKELYRQVAALVGEKQIDLLIAIGPAISAHASLFTGVEALFYADTHAFLQQHDFTSFHQMGILIKGAREFGFERITHKLQLKDHQTLLEINLDAMVHNLNVFRAILRPGTRIMAMVKAFSYGSGSYEIASLLQFQGVDYLAVAFADEGVDLRMAGITLPIVVLNPELHNLDVLLRYGLEPEVYSLNLLKRLSEEVKLWGRHNSQNPFIIHLKLDTGMHRLGFTRNELSQLLEGLNRNPLLRVGSVFSHLAASDKPEFDSFSREQMDAFEQMVQTIKKSLGYPFLVHMANSAGISRFPAAHFDMVRLGIGLYGVDSSGQLHDKLQNVTTFKSVISQIRELPPGESVGYNRAAILSRPTRMAVVPVGYADGLSRRLGNGKGYMLVNGKPAPTLGNISMDMCCLDITGIEAEEGDEVIIFGEGLPVQRIAQWQETIPYEIFTSIPPRVKRVYFSE